MIIFINNYKKSFPIEFALKARPDYYTPSEPDLLLAVFKQLLKF